MKGITVLVADDDAEVRGTIAEYLRAHDFEVTEAANGFDALLQVKRGRPRTVVLDLLMPRLGGLPALRQIREAAPETLVVVITGASDPGLSEQALSSGATAVLAKPLNLEQLRGLLSGPPGPRSASAGSAASGRSGAGVKEVSAGRVLIVDDDADVREFLDEFLTVHGYTTRAVGDAAGAFWALMQEVPDVILLDISMPGLSGVEIIPAIRFQSRDVKIIMVSGVTNVELSKRALAQGAFDYITKPVDVDYLLQSLETALSMKRLEAE